MGISFQLRISLMKKEGTQATGPTLLSLERPWTEPLPGKPQQPPPPPINMLSAQSWSPAACPRDLGGQSQGAVSFSTVRCHTGTLDGQARRGGGGGCASLGGRQGILLFSPPADSFLQRGTCDLPESWGSNQHPRHHKSECPALSRRLNLLTNSRSYLSAGPWLCLPGEPTLDTPQLSGLKQQHVVCFRSYGFIWTVLLRAPGSSLKAGWPHSQVW